MFAVGAVVYAVSDRGDPADEAFEPNPPTTREEREAAAVALSYARAAQRDDVAAACELVARDMARRLRCRTARADIPGDLRNIPREAPLRATSARLRGDGGTVHVESPSGVGQRVELILRGTVWRVIRAEPMSRTA